MFPCVEIVRGMRASRLAMDGLGNAWGPLCGLQVRSHIQFYVNVSVVIVQPWILRGAIGGRR